MRRSSQDRFSRSTWRAGRGVAFSACSDPACCSCAGFDFLLRDALPPKSRSRCLGHGRAALAAHGCGGDKVSMAAQDTIIAAQQLGLGYSDWYARQKAEHLRTVPSTSRTLQKLERCGYCRRMSPFRKSVSSPQNSVPVGPPPTTTKDRILQKAPYPVGFGFFRVIP